MDIAIEAVGSGAAVQSTVTPMAEGAGWFRRLYEREAGLMKVILVP